MYKWLTDPQQCNKYTCNRKYKPPYSAKHIFIPESQQLKHTPNEVKEVKDKVKDISINYFRSQTLRSTFFGQSVDD